VTRLDAVRAGLVMVLIVAAFIVTGGAFLNLRAASTSLGQSLVSQIARAYASEAQTTLNDDRKLLDEVARLFDPSAEWSAQARFLLHFGPGLDPGSKVIYGTADGEALTVGRPGAGGGEGAPARLRVQHTTADGRGVRYEAEGGGRSLPPPPPYDPRQRPWYRAAEEGREWTVPYFFSDDGQPGITRVIRLGRGVLGLDVPLSTLATVTEGYVRKLPNGETATILLLGAHDEVLVGPEESARIVRAAESENAVVRSAASADQDGDFRFDAGGEGWLATRVSFPVGTSGERWRVVAAIPAGTGQGFARRQWWLTVVVGVLGTSLFFLLERRIRRLSAQVRDARALGRYTLEERLGQGGMGEVWRARHQMLARPAAVKLIPADRRDPDALARFEREAQATAALRSPHTVSIYDYGISGEGVFYYVMELLEGLDLDALVNRFGPQPPGRVVSILRQCCASLEEAHEAGLIHRDVKPSNIFLCKLGTEVDFVKLLDFGIVKEVASAASGALVGTPGYLAPEQVDGRPLPASDIYSLGCVAWWMLTGRPVHGEENILDILISVKRGGAPEPPPGGLGPPSLEALVLRCLAADPAARPSARALTDLLSDCDVPPWTEGEAERWWREWTPGAGPEERWGGTTVLPTRVPENPA
jgi:hypothetical protein